MGATILFAIGVASSGEVGRVAPAVVWGLVILGATVIAPLRTVLTVTADSVTYRSIRTTSVRRDKIKALQLDAGAGFAGLDRIRFVDDDGNTVLEVSASLFDRGDVESLRLAFGL